MEDVAHDMIAHAGAAGNPYDFAFGVNWSGVVAEERVSKYKRVK